jgi:hypothetical protein
VSEPDEKTISETNFLVNSVHQPGSCLRSEKDDTNTVPQSKGKASGFSPKNRLLYRNDDAAQVCGVMPRTWRTWSRLGLNPQPITIGKTIFWRVDELTKWVEAGCPRRRDWIYNPVMDAARKLSGFSR